MGLPGGFGLLTARLNPLLFFGPGSVGLTTSAVQQECEQWPDCLVGAV